MAWQVLKSKQMIMRLVLLEEELSLFLWIVEIQLPEYPVLLWKEVSLSVQTGYAIIVLCRFTIY